MILDREGPSSRYRVLQYLPYLEQAGLDVQVSEIPRGPLGRLALFRLAREFDMVLLQKKLLSLPEWAALRGWARQILFDLDDAIMFRDSRHGATRSRRRTRRFQRTARESDLVLAGNSYLARMALVAGARVEVIPTPIDVERYGVRVQGQSSRVRIGWIGSRSTVWYLEPLHPVLRDLCRKFKQVEVAVICDSFPHWTDLPLVRVPWSGEQEIQELHKLDVGLMPLTDDPWSRGKCGFKLLQYMAVGLPVVCSPVGANAEMVSHGSQGFLATTDQQWYSCLESLVKDPELRRRMGEQARRTVMDRYSLAVWADRLGKLLKGLCGETGEA